MCEKFDLKMKGTTVFLIHILRLSFEGRFKERRFEERGDDFGEKRGDDFCEKSERGLRNKFYEKSCPQAERIVWDFIWEKLSSSGNSGLPAKLLRMHFHDCLVRVLSFTSLATFLSWLRSMCVFESLVMMVKEIVGKGPFRT
ncbi:hypothetical protein AMTR_s01279p00010080 [Amborella trichopoda]|uniref:Plant heme peroxidase family profile domain-containing protein n=1 Tax=Amborella trichopoda TaxID=13333 RepID=W1NPH4_AMBTC|nr:hypothetical protein AMTR_s01279p00010080 [Amborella trichopoda]